MAWRQHLDFSPVPFVREKEQETDTLPSKTSNCRLGPVQDGNDVRNFYEEIVGLQNTGSQSEAVLKSSKTKKRSVKVSRTESSQSDEQGEDTDIISTTDNRLKLQVNSFLRAAAQGEMRKVRKMLEEGVDVNVKDLYGWTALMCASQAGQADMVEVLLANGADRWIRDRKGSTAMDIALKSKHKDLREMIQRWSGVNRSDAFSATSKVSRPQEPYFCNTCGTSFADTSADSHNTSTLHLFNLRLQPKPTAYQISEHNPGFRMMLRSGWNQEKGLGPEGRGTKFPVKTVLKRDRKGLGVKSNSKAKVTHFGPADRTSVKRVKQRDSRTSIMKASTLSKKAAAVTASRDKRKEINFRRQFNME